MAKKQKEETIQDGTLSQEDVVVKRTHQGIKYLHGVTPGGIPEWMQKPLSEHVRDGRKRFDYYTEIMESVTKNSDKYSEAAREREKIAKSYITADSQIKAYNAYQEELKRIVPNTSKGTNEKSLYNNMLVGGAQADAVGFDPDGKLKFGSVYGKGKDDVSILGLDDMLSTTTGSSPIITEPVGTKAQVWKMAEKTKLDSNAGKPFDADWTYTRVHNNLTEGGPQNIIGVAFADLAGDNQSKSFAKQYEDGLADPSYYIHPESGETIPPDSSWMKDPNNADILQKFLGKYITNIMKDVYGPTIDEETGLIKQSTSQLAQDLIKKYSK